MKFKTPGFVRVVSGKITRVKYEKSEKWKRKRKSKKKYQYE